jgi:hypothetical protein
MWSTDSGDPPSGGTIVDSRWTNQGITTGNNNIYFSTIKLENEILSNNC